MNFETAIIGADGIKYFLHIRVLYIDTASPIRTYYLFVTISKLVGKAMIPADRLALRYSVDLDVYVAIGKVEGVRSMLYNDIIQRLDETFGISWGYDK